MATQSCNKCLKVKATSDFPFKMRGENRGIEKTKNCSSCIARDAKKRRESKEANKENVDVVPAHTITPMDDFLTALRNHAGHIDIKTRVKIQEVGVGTMEGKKKADVIAKQVWESTRYWFAYLGSYEHKKNGGTSVNYNYHCVQLEQRKHKSKKVEDAEKQRDKESMRTYDCHGWLRITIFTGTSDALVRLTHKCDHPPYWCINIPQDIKELIKEGKSKKPAQLWTEILEIYPNPSFSRKAVHSLWSDVVREQYQLDKDDLVSARALLEKGQKAGCLGMYTTMTIDLPEVDHCSALAWSLPDILVKWSGRIREIGMDSTWKTNGKNYELYSVMGEAYGSGLPLGYLLLQSKGGAPGGTQKILTAFLEHFKTTWKLKILFTLTDKDKREINACRQVFPNAKHQLCFWHALRAIKQRLATIRRMPGYYHVNEAHEEFPWINITFVPNQQTPHSTYISPPLTQTLPRITVRLNGETIAVPIPEVRAPPQIMIKIRRTALQDYAASAADVANQQGTPERSIADSDEGDLEGGEKDDAMEDNLHMEVDNELGDDGAEMDVEDAPDFAFEDDEKRAPDPNYTFCPAPHRRQLLHLFTRHFCMHPSMPDRTGTHTAARIRIIAVTEMYTFCFDRNLCEVWGYMWTQWYSPKQWALWARSTSPYISRLRTTMTIENSWRQMKHNSLKYLFRPRLDHLLWIIQTEVVPGYIQRAGELEDMYRLGRSRSLTNYQRYFKTAWLKLSKVPLNKTYKTDVLTWQCNCGQQALNRHHICKHLVQAVPKPPIGFWRQVVRRRTVPLYRHEALVPKDTDRESARAKCTEDGSITDGDDHTHNGHDSDLRDGGWRDLLGEAAMGAIGDAKRKQEDSEGPGVVELTEVSSDVEMLAVEDHGSGQYCDADQSDSEDEEEIRRTAEQTHKDLLMVGAAVKEQLRVGGSSIWLRSNNRTCAPIRKAANDLRYITTTARKRPRTWPKNKRERKLTQNTMGFQGDLSQSKSSDSDFQLEA